MQYCKKCKTLFADMDDQCKCTPEEHKAAWEEAKREYDLAYELSIINRATFGVTKPVEKE
jgi:hypothetical protein